MIASFGLSMILSMLVSACGSPIDASGRVDDVGNLPFSAGSWARGVPEAIIESMSQGDPYPTSGGAAGFAAWTDVPNLFYLVTWGSSSCPDLPEPQARTSNSKITVRLRRGYWNACTADLVPTTSIVAVPDGVDSSQPISVRIENTDPFILEPRER